MDFTLVVVLGGAGEPALESLVYFMNSSASILSSSSSWLWREESEEGGESRSSILTLFWIFFLEKKLFEFIGTLYYIVGQNVSSPSLPWSFAPRQAEAEFELRHPGLSLD